MSLCRNGLHSKDGPGRCVECKRANKRRSNVVRRDPDYLPQPQVDGLALGRLIADWASKLPDTREAYALLARRTETTPRPLSEDTVWRIATGRRARVLLYEIADPIVCALRCPYVLSNKTLTVFGERSPQEEVAA